MAGMKTQHVTDLNFKYGLPVDAFDKICQIVFEYSEIDVYEQNGSIVVVGPIMNKNEYYPIEILRDLLWEEISMHTSIIFKHFTIDVSNTISVAVTAYFVNKFGRTSIVDCLLVGQIVDPERVRFGFLGNGCAFTGNL